jgi:hypothetical protein
MEIMETALIALMMITRMVEDDLILTKATVFN